jgi:hypothetical protein
LFTIETRVGEERIERGLHDEKMKDDQSSNILCESIRSREQELTRSRSEKREK